MPLARQHAIDGTPCELHRSRQLGPGKVFPDLAGEVQEFKSPSPPIAPDSRHDVDGKAPQRAAGYRKRVDVRHLACGQEPVSHNEIAESIDAVVCQ